MSKGYCLSVIVQIMWEALESSDTSLLWIFWRYQYWIRSSDPPPSRTHAGIHYWNLSSKSFITSAYFTQNKANTKILFRFFFHFLHCYLRIPMFLFYFSVFRCIIWFSLFDEYYYSNSLFQFSVFQCIVYCYFIHFLYCFFRKIVYAWFEGKVSLWLKYCIRWI